MQQIRHYILPLLSVIALLINIVWLMSNHRSPPPMSDINATNTYPLLSKRIFAESQNDMLLDFVPLRKQLEDKIGRINGTKSFYFEYLPSGTSIKIGADNTLIAASLIKVPLTMNLYKAAELGKVDLDKQITITDRQLNDAYGNLWQKGAGTKITLREAAKLALSESDNTASQVIFDNINGLLSPDQESLNNFDIEQNMQNGQAVIDATSYGSVLKGLYLSSYLKREHSQEVLAYLSQSTAQNRMTAQLPKDVTVAHKIGVYNRSWSESDCGIVYAKQRPYLLCVMLGVSEEESDKHIAELSKLVYDYVINQP